MPLGTVVGLGPGDIVLDGDPSLPPPKAEQHSLLFGACLLWINGRPSQQLLSSCSSIIIIRPYRAYYVRRCGLLLQTEQHPLYRSVCLSVGLSQL